MVTKFIAMFALVLSVALVSAAPVFASPPVTVEASANPSLAGDAVTFTVTGISTQGNVVTTASVVNVATGETTRYTLSGPTDTFTHTFADSGEYFINVFQQRNGKQVLDLAYYTQIVN